MPSIAIMFAGKGRSKVTRGLSCSSFLGMEQTNPSPRTYSGGDKRAGKSWQAERQQTPNNKNTWSRAWAGALMEGGFESEIVASGEEAITLLQGDPTKYRALLTDIHLKGTLTGWDVAKRARELNPEMPVVYMTGAAADQWPSHGVPNSVLLNKPFAPAQSLPRCLSCSTRRPRHMSEAAYSAASSISRRTLPLLAHLRSCRRLTEVRSLRQSGGDLLSLSSSHCDPVLTFGRGLRARPPCGATNAAPRGWI